MKSPRSVRIIRTAWPSSTSSITTVILIARRGRPASASSLRLRSWKSSQSPEPSSARSQRSAMPQWSRSGSDLTDLFTRRFTSRMVLQRLDAAGLHVPERIDGAGRRCGGKPFSRGHLYKILSNPIYIGRLSHRGKTYDGQHPAIVEQATWDGAQARLASHAHRRACRQLASAHLLMGRLQDDRGHAMTPTHAQKGSRRYRYYVSQAVLQGKPEPGSIARVPAPEIEALVISAMRSASPTNPALSDGDLILNHLHRVTLHEGRIEIAINGEDEAPINLPWSRQSAQRRREILVPEGSEPDLRPMKVEDRSRILKAIARGRTWLEDLLSGQVAGTEEIAIRERCSERSIRMTLSLAFLSPEVVQAIIAGRLPRGIAVTGLADLPPSWNAQHAALGV